MPEALELLRDAARDEWSDPVFTAQLAVDGLMELSAGDWDGQGRPAARMLRRARPDSPLLLAVTEAVLESSAREAADRLGRLRKSLADRSWTAELGLAVAHHHSLGVPSLAKDLLEVLEAAAQMGESRAELYTDRRAVARGLGYLGLAVEVAPPEEAEALLIPALATAEGTAWVPERSVDLCLAASVRGKPVVVVVHPLARLSPACRPAFQPPESHREVRLPV